MLIASLGTLLQAVWWNDTSFVPVFSSYILKIDKSLTDIEKYICTNMIPNKLLAENLACISMVYCVSLKKISWQA